MTDRLPDPAGHLDDPVRKRAYARALFDRIAPRYDRFTRWFSFGMDGRWKAALGREVGDLGSGIGDRAVVLDLACGSGDLLQAVRRDGGRAVVRVGVDLSRTMLRIARERIGAVPLVCGDLGDLPVRDRSVDVVTIGYGLRNAPSLEQTLGEIARVLKPGGVLLSLDFALPASRAWRRVYLAYLRIAGRLVGRWWHRDPAAYGYIAASLEGWMTADELGERLGAAGFEVERMRTWLGGGMALHVARRRIS